MKDKAYKIAKNRRYTGYQKTLASMVHKFFDKKTGSDVSVNEQQAEELHKSVIKKFKRTKVNVGFKDNIWAANLTEMKSLSLKNKNVTYLLYVIMFSLNRHEVNLWKIKK